ncbi:MAG: cation:proton antiporter [Solirubrobacteraceae bacterium]|nr:cation:proton antiporter [Solirubrobacteraceae bacterium]
MSSDWLLALLGLALIVAVAQLGGAIAGRLRQPRIVGEMLAVVIVGPTVLGGQVAGMIPGQDGRGLVADVFPQTSVALLTIVGGLGLVLYVLLVGITIDLAPLRRRAGAIGLTATVVAGSMVALALVAGPLLTSAGGWKPAGVTQGAFVIALAAGLAASGVPVVARILEERSLLRSELGALVIVAAAIVTGGALIASAVAIGGGDAGAGGRVAVRLGAGLAALALVLAIVRAARISLPRPAVVAAVLALAVLSAVAGDALISSALIGPLVIGVAVGAGGGTAAAVERLVGVVVRRVLLPVFLGVAALHTDLRELGPAVFAPVAALVVAVIAVKLAAGYATARAAGFRRGEATAIGALLQCGGTMTIAISLDVLQAGVIGARMHATLTLIGLVTTVVAGPLLRRSGVVGVAVPATPTTP